MTPLDPAIARKAALSLEGKRVLVMGLGLLGGGVQATRFVAEQGADVTVTDTNDERGLAPSIEALADLDVFYRLGGHDENDFSRVDLVVANPAVPVNSPYLEIARSSGVPVTTEIGLFLARCVSPVFAVTGSSGKTTTTMMLGRMVHKKWPASMVGGNLGVSLLGELPKLGENAPVVLELSSFQLRHLRAMAWRPNLAVVTNFSENHLDVHGTLEDYRASKQAILAFQIESDAAVLNAEDSEVIGWETAARVIYFGVEAGSKGPSHGQGAFLRDGAIWMGDDRLVAASDLHVPGIHNVSNACAAAAAASAVGVSPGDVREVLLDFEGIEHRLECVGAVEGVTYINDSIATSPDRTAVALEAVDGEIVLIAGGYDKGISFDALGPKIAQHVRCLVVMGETANALAASVEGTGVEVKHADDLDKAVAAARGAARAGDTVLLCPASASYGMFANFEERGCRFKALVKP